MTVLINLPQRFQAVNGLSPFEAGIRVLPLLLASPVATAISSQLVTRLNVPPFYLAVMGTALQILGVGLASSTQADGDRALLGYQAVMGLGFGTTLVTILIYVPFVVDRVDLGEICLQLLDI
jgi:cellobiose-specific phosphotransferase system component IIC